jgi:hypothetical protein
MKTRRTKAESAATKRREIEVPTEETTTSLPATGAASGSLPAHLAARMSEDAGKGTSQRADDNIVPMIAVLQPLSPQVDRRNGKYIEGAEPGDILLKLNSPPIVKGTEGFLFQPCHFSRQWVRWVSRSQGGGFRGRFDELPPDAQKVFDQRLEREVYRMPDGDELNDTRYHVGLAYLPGGAMPYVIPLTSTGHTVSRTWQALMNGIRLPDDRVAPSFSRLYRLRTTQRTNKAGTWFQFDVSHHDWADDRQYERGRQLYESLAAGERTIESETDEHSPSAPSSGTSGAF